jgi:hypothetical protein
MTLTLTGGPALTTDAPSTLTLTISNSNAVPGVTNSSDWTVTVTLPASLRLYGDPPPGCMRTASGFTCMGLPGLNPGESLPPFGFTVIAPALITNAAIEAMIAGDLSRISSPASNTTQKIATATAQPAAVPALTELAPA